MHACVYACVYACINLALSKGPIKSIETLLSVSQQFNNDVIHGTVCGRMSRHLVIGFSRKQYTVYVSVHMLNHERTHKTNTPTKEGDVSHTANLFLVALHKYLVPLHYVTMLSSGIITSLTFSHKETSF